MNYIDALAARFREAVQTSSPDSLIRLYVLLILVKGTETTLEDIHDAWSAHKAGTDPAHEDIVPFAELDPFTQEKDRKYLTAIVKIAAEKEEK